MKICNNCGVELDAEMNFCPLCGSKFNAPKANAPKKHAEKDTKHQKTTFNFDDLSKRQQQRFVWELSAFILISCSVITLIIDLLIAKQVTWSKYTLTVGMILLMDVSIIIFMQKRMLLLFASLFLSTSFLLFLLDLYNKHLDTGVKLGIPILFFTFVVLMLLFLVIQKTKTKGVNIIAYTLMALGVICMCIEGIISVHALDMIRLQWSFIVMVAILPVSAILLYIHYRLSKVTNFKKMFHI